MRSARFAAITAAAALAALLSAGLTPAGAQQTDTPPADAQADSADVAPEAATTTWWDVARSGMFVHWGLYAIPAGTWTDNNGTTRYYPDSSEWMKASAHIIDRNEIPDDFLKRIPANLQYTADPAGYDALIAQFDPTDFNADEWVAAAKSAGMKYLVVTAKHHDGFAMWPSAYTDYDIAATPFGAGGRDFLGELGHAARAQGLGFGLYYSILDWHHPAFSFNADQDQCFNPAYWDDPIKCGIATSKLDNPVQYRNYMVNQLAELRDRYHPDTVWFDGGWFNGWDCTSGRNLVNKTKQLMPGVLVNERALPDGCTGNVDYKTPESEVRTLPLMQAFDPAAFKAYLNRSRWEAALKMNENWGYNAGDDNWKSPDHLVRLLNTAWNKGGNTLLNVGPDAQGQIPDPSLVRLAAIGNDDFGNPQVLPAGKGGEGTEGTLRYRTVQSGEPGPGTRSAWYRWTPGAGATLDATFGTGYVSGLDVRVFEGTTPAGLTSVNDWQAEPYQVRFAAVAGHTYFIRVAGSGTGGPFTLNRTASPLASVTPAIATQDSKGLVAYADDRDAGHCIFTSSLAVSAIREISTTSSFVPVYCVRNHNLLNEKVSRPAVAWNGNRYLVVWGSESNEVGPAITTNSIMGRFVGIDGVPTGAPFTIAASVAGDDPAQVVGHPAIDALGTTFLVSWVDSNGIEAARVSDTGTVVDPGGIRLTSAAGNQDNPSVRAGSGAWLVAWDDGRSAATRGLDIYGTLVQANGTVSSPDGRAISTATRDQWRPSVAWNGSIFEVAWADARTFSTTVHDIYASRVSAAGVTLDPAGLAIGTRPGKENQPALVRSNSRFIAVFADNRSGAFDVRGTLLRGTDGKPVTGTTAPVTQIGGDQWSPAAAPLPSGYALTVWEDWRDVGGHAGDIYASIVYPMSGAVAMLNGWAVAA